MAQKDARIRFLERELAEREKEMETMKVYDQPPVSEAVGREHPEAEEERLQALERKVRDLEALVKGLMEEVLDLKSVAMKLSRETEERRRRPVAAEERKAATTLRAEPRAGAEPAAPSPTAAPRTPARPVEKQPEAPAPDVGEMDLIMQNDGTLKPEPRRSSEYIVASARFGNAPVKGRGKGGKTSERTLFVEQKKRSVDDVIQAEEDDTVDLER